MGFLHAKDIVNPHGGPYNVRRGGVMIIQSRTDIGRNRLIYILAIILSISALVTAISQYSASSDAMRAALLILGAVSIVAIILSVIQLLGVPRRSSILLIYQKDEMIFATNALHEGFKLRFLRDVLSENTINFSDADRVQWKFLEDDGYFPALCVRSPKKRLILKLCTMVFDDVYFIDSTNRWEHHDSSNTSEPTFSTPEKPHLRGWKGVVSSS
jgi:hypothetical protein